MNHHVVGVGVGVLAGRRGLVDAPPVGGVAEKEVEVLLGPARGLTDGGDVLGKGGVVRRLGAHLHIVEAGGHDPEHAHVNTMCAGQAGSAS